MTPARPDTPPLTLLQELQTQSHEDQMGVRDPETGQKQKKGEGRDREQREGDTGDQRESKGWGGVGARALGKGVGSKGGLQR